MIKKIINSVINFIITLKNIILITILITTSITLMSIILLTIIILTSILDKIDQIEVFQIEKEIL